MSFYQNPGGLAVRVAVRCGLRHGLQALRPMARPLTQKRSVSSHPLGSLQGAQPWPSHGPADALAVPGLPHLLADGRVRGR